MWHRRRVSADHSRRCRKATSSSSIRPRDGSTSHSATTRLPSGWGHGRHPRRSTIAASWPSTQLWSRRLTTGRSCGWDLSCRSDGETARRQERPGRLTPSRSSCVGEVFGGEDGAGEGEEVVGDDLGRGERIWRLTGPGDEGAAESGAGGPGNVPTVRGPGNVPTVRG